MVRRFFLSVSCLSLLAAAPATSPSTPLLTEARHILNNLKDTRYTHPTQIDESAGRYHCDCSGLIDYCLKQISPPHYTLLHHPAHKRPLAIDFYTAFSSAPTIPTASSPAWQHILSLADARPGDVLAWRFATQTSGKDTGHVVLFDSTPIPDGEHIFRVTVIDSTGSPHADDTRPIGATGVGRGTLWFKVDDQNQPLGFRWRSNGTKFTELPIAIARPLNLQPAQHDP